MLGRLIGWARSVAPWPGWLVVGVVWALAMGVNSQRWHFGADDRFYLAWAYHFGGLSESEAGHRSYEFLTGFDWFASFCWIGCNTDAPQSYDWLFRGAEGGLFAQRLVYPLLSAPFVRLLGPNGMLVVPFVAYAVSVVLVMVLARRLLGSRGWAVAAGVTYLVPISIAKFALYAYTEALAMCLIAACLLVLPVARAPRRWDPAILGGLLVVFAFTRQFHWALVLGVVVAWVGASVAHRSVRNPWLPFAAVAVVVTAVVAVVQGLMSPGYSLLRGFLDSSHAGTVDGIPAVLPDVVATIVRGEVEVAGQDFGLVLVAVLGVVGLVLGRREPLAQLTAGLLVGIFGLEFITALPSDNRYWSLAVPALALLAVQALRWLVGLRAFSSEAPPLALPRQPGARRPAVIVSTTDGKEPATKA